MSMTQVENIYQYAGWTTATEFVIPVDWQQWLLCPNSLTAKLKQTAKEFRVQLLQHSSKPLPEGLAQRWQQNDGICREVLLVLSDRPYVFAQSWFPLSTLQALQPLAELGTQPLGEFIFQQSDVQRSAIEVASFKDGLQGEPHLQIPQSLWGRRSFFSLQQHELLVQEIFLAKPDV